MREPRLGDIIDDFCVKCKRIMNHAVVSIVNQEPAKVRCRTCHNDHDYRHEIPPPPKVDPRKAALFNQVLAKVAPGETIDPVEAAEDLEAADPEEGADEAVAEEAAEESAEEPVAEAPAPRKAKAKKR
jgi:hypothetical protein